jgi:alcohol dehydrogenase class IV
MLPTHNPISLYTWPGPAHFGFGAAALVGPEARALGARHAFVVADPGVVSAGLVEPILASLKSAGIATAVYDRVKGNPDIDSVEAAAQAFRESGADLVIGVGGGSALDTAKVVRLLAPGGRVAEYDLLLGDRVRAAPPDHEMPPLIAIPTTAGTGSEVTAWAVITDVARQFKISLGGAFLIPQVALIDPELTMGLPPYFTAGTGMDALTHLIESYVSTTDHPVIDAMIPYGMELVGRSLRPAVAQGKSNRDARRDMLLASFIGGLTLNNKWGGACHSLAHQLSSFAGVHHGVANALMLPAQMEHGLAGALEKYAHVGEALGAPQDGSLRDRAGRAVQAVRELNADIGLPAHLRDVGVTEEMIPAMAKNAYLDNAWETNPRAIEGEADLEAIFRQTY